MAENLRYNIEGSWCYDNDEANCQDYGRLYTWDAAKKACPAGWHLPTREEWDELVSATGDSSVAGKKLKSKSGWDYKGNGTDEFGFSALPGGYRDTYGTFDCVGVSGSWWVDTEYGSDEAYQRYTDYDLDVVYDEDYYEKSWGVSVRYVKD
jgi:uncharacterized protein (TIGR02145 family)